MTASFDANASSRDLVAAVLSRHELMKVVGPLLDARPPDLDAAEYLLTHRSEPWLTAYLLGCVGHEHGYDLVLRILLDSPGRLAESYAGVALAKINPSRAAADLVRMLADAPKWKSRDGAAWGLGSVPLTLEIAHALLLAVADGKISSAPAVSALGNCARQPDVVIDGVVSVLTMPLETGEDARRRLITDLAWDGFLVAGRAIEREALMTRLRPFVEKILEDEAFSMHPSKRRTLSTWVRATSG